jgi:diadenosine tetraphosphate (Ap4A) HIT family hydrolase
MSGKWKTVWPLFRRVRRDSAADDEDGGVSKSGAIDNRVLQCSKQVGSLAVNRNQNCRYCTGFLNPQSDDRNAIWNTRLVESENFVVVPTLGMLSPGWLLVVSKDHYLSIGALDDTLYPELEQVKTAVQKDLREMFQAPIFFEHGPCTPTETAGACIDHAHLHAVPLSFDLFQDLATNYPYRKVKGLRALKGYFEKHIPYLYYENRKEEAYLFRASQVPGQLVRRLIAKRLGMPDLWDWGVYEGMENIEKTLSRYELRRVPIRIKPNLSSTPQGR